MQCRSSSCTLYGFNPSFVLELTATPKDITATTGRIPRPARYANILVDVQGTEFDREGMIDVPLNLDADRGLTGGQRWQQHSNACAVSIVTLEEARAQTGRSVRPILLVQVKRTGVDQRDGQHIHRSLDVRDWLKTAGLDDGEIVIKTADTNDLADPKIRIFSRPPIGCA